MFGKNGVRMEAQTLGLQIGSVCCALKLKDEGVYSRLKRLYRDFFTERAGRVDGVEAYLRFVSQIIVPAYIGKKDRRAVYSLMADFSREITQTIPVYELEFSLDADRLWKVIGDLEELLGRVG
jgi:hypothetical protein